LADPLEGHRVYVSPSALFLIRGFRCFYSGPELIQFYESTEKIKIDLRLIPILHPNDTPDFLKNGNQAVKEGSDFEMELRFADRKRDTYV
jgi:hypothetical protein